MASDRNLNVYKKKKNISKDNSVIIKDRIMHIYSHFLANLKSNCIKYIHNYIVGCTHIKCNIFPNKGTKKINGNIDVWGSRNDSRE